MHGDGPGSVLLDGAQPKGAQRVAVADVKLPLRPSVLHLNPEGLH